MIKNEIDLVEVQRYCSFAKLLGQKASFQKLILVLNPRNRMITQIKTHRQRDSDKNDFQCL